MFVTCVSGGLGGLTVEPKRFHCSDVGIILEKEMATPSNILAWEIPWTEEPDGL